MPAYARAALAPGIIAAVILLLNGGWSGLLLGFMAGAGAAILALSSGPGPRAARRTRRENGRVASAARSQPGVAPQNSPRPRAKAGPTTTFIGEYLQQERLRPAEAMRVATLAGASAGALLLLAELLRELVLAPLAGLPPAPPAQVLAAAVGSLAIATLSGAAVGWIETLDANTRRWGLFLLFGAFLVAYPYVDHALGIGWIGPLIAVLIFVLLGLGLNIVVGYAGLLDLGYAAFFAIGAYATGLLDSPQLGIHWNFWLVIWIAAAVAALFGIVLGAPTLPLRGDYLAIVTLGFGEIVPIVFRNLTAVTIKEPVTSFIAGLTNHPALAICLLGCAKAINLTAGEQGVNPIGRPALPLIGEFRAGVYEPWFYLIILLILLSVFAINRMRQSRLGRAWTAIREDELAASAMGIDLVKTKLMAFAMGATFSGFAGAFFAAYISAIFPSTFDFSISVIVLCMVILGGMGNMTGVILGALLIQSADRIFLPQFAALLKGLLTTSVYPHVANAAARDFLATSLDPQQLRLLLFGLTLVIMMQVRPEGLVPSARRRAELRETEAPGEELGEASRQPPAPSEAASPSPAIV